MTSPVPHGYPDWARQSAESDMTVLYHVGEALAGATTLGPFFVGGMPYLYLAFSASGLRNRIQFSYYLDAAMTQLVDQDAVTISQNGGYTGSITVFGPYVTITIESSTYPQTYTAKVLMAPGARAATGANASAGQLALGAPANVPAATNVDNISVATWRGCAVFYAELPAVASEIHLYHRRFDNSLILVWRLVGNGLRETVKLALQPSIIVVRLVNPSAAAQNFFYALNAERYDG